MVGVVGLVVATVVEVGAMVVEVMEAVNVAVVVVMVVVVVTILLVVVAEVVCVNKSAMVPEVVRWVAGVVKAEVVIVCVA